MTLKRGPSQVDIGFGNGYNHFGSLAQVVEQRTLNPLVQGSSPWWPTNSPLAFGTPFHWVMRLIIPHYTLITHAQAEELISAAQQIIDMLG